MKKILFLHETAQELFYTQGRDNSHSPYIRLRKAFEKHNYRFDIEPICELQDYDYILTIDLFPNGVLTSYNTSKRTKVNRKIFHKAIELGLSSKLVVFLSECPVIAPYNEGDLLSKVGTVFTWNSGIVDNEKYFSFVLPISNTRYTDKVIDFESRKLIMNISGNKFSAQKGELYSKRRSIIKTLEILLPENFSLYGVGWNDNNLITHIKRFLRYRQLDFNTYKSYKGAPSSKNSVISNYKFGLCIENAMYNGYVTEKIFDILLNGSIPVYYGAQDITNYIDQDLFVNLCEFESAEALIDHLKLYKNQDYKRHQELLSSYLASPKFQVFTEDFFASNVISVLCQRGR